MKTGVIYVNFGEPAVATEAYVQPFLERIFFQNASLEAGDEAARRERSRELAERRAPGLVTEYEEIGGSPLNAQADAQAAALERVLTDRGMQIRVFSAFQYTDPSIDEQVARAQRDGCDELIALPGYPLCGHSTTVLALRDVRRAVEELGWEVDLHEISGWHLHPDFLPMWADHIRDYLRQHGIELQADRTELVFSIHGTPIKYLEEGNRYDRYTNEACAAVAGLLGAETYYMGYQNHTNRGIEWTMPDVDDVVRELGTSSTRVVVVPIAFLHEQSETLSELDDDLREVAVSAGLEFYRVPVPHDDPRLVSALADLVQSRLARAPSTGNDVEWRRCICRGQGGLARCTNGLRLSGKVERGPA